MSDTNRVFIMGRLTKDAQLKQIRTDLRRLISQSQTTVQKSIRTEHGGRPLISST